MRGQLPPGADCRQPHGRRAPHFWLRTRGSHRAVREEGAGVAQVEPGAADGAPGGHAEDSDSAAH